MTIDLHIVVSVVQLIVIGIGGLYFLWTMRSRLDLLIQETKLKHDANLLKFEDIDKKLTTLAATTVELVRQQMRMDHLDERVQELSNRITEKIMGTARLTMAKSRRSKD